MSERTRARSDRVTPSEQDTYRIERALLSYAFRMATISMFGLAVVTLVFAAAVVGPRGGPRLALWCGLQFVALSVNVAALVRFRRGGFGTSVARARRAYRIGVFASGLVWALAGVFWPVAPELGPGLILMFCYAGMCAGGATTLAGDPVAYALFCGTALAPDVVLAFPHFLVVSALLIAFLTLTSLMVVQNSDTLRESLALRFENHSLLRQTIVEREDAVSARAVAEKAVAAKTRFLAAASHDLRQPVQALSLFVDVLEREPAVGREREHNAVTALARTTVAMRAMIESLLDISRLDAGLVAGAPTAVALAPLLDEVIAATRDEADAHAMIVHAAGRPLFAHVDPVLLDRVVHNLAANAVRHARNGRVLLALRRRREFAEIQVWDQGPGIAEADRERIFDEFVQLENRARDRRKGLGLGLPMVRRICALNGWELVVRSTPGRGSVFSVRVPLASAAATAELVQALPDTERPLSIVLLEDDFAVVEATVPFLEASGHAVRVFSDVEAVWHHLEAKGAAGGLPDLLIADQRVLHDESGADLIARLSGSEHAQVASILLTGDVDVPVGGADPRRLVLRKPVGANALRVAIRRAVSGRGGSLPPT